MGPKILALVELLRGPGLNTLKNQKRFLAWINAMTYWKHLKIILVLPN
jgi:hypothetical protein